jgi:hypothetical protein
VNGFTQNRTSFGTNALSKTIRTHVGSRDGNNSDFVIGDRRNLNASTPSSDSNTSNNNEKNVQKSRKNSSEEQNIEKLIRTIYYPKEEKYAL